MESLSQRVGTFRSFRLTRLRRAPYVRVEGCLRLLFVFTLLAITTQACSSRSSLPKPNDGGIADGDSSKDGGDCKIAERCVDSSTSDSPPSDSASVPCLGPCSDDLGQRPKPLPAPQCPNDEPTLGQPCQAAEATCSYGDELEVACRRFYQCEMTWTTPERLPVSCEEARRATESCPAKPPVQGGACTVSSAGQGVGCSYSNVTCYCRGRALLPPGGPGSWTCVGPPEDPRCPAILPNLGTGCAVNGVECVYVGDGCSAQPYTNVFCFRGAWEEGQGSACAG